MEVGPGMKRKRKQRCEDWLSQGDSEDISSTWTWGFIERGVAAGDNLGKRGKKEEAG